MAPFGGFDHNAHALHLVVQGEQRYASFDGLNLSWETREGMIKHNGPLLHAHAYVAAHAEAHHIPLHNFASAEAQIAALADDIAYNTHDIDDGLRAGLFTLQDLAPLPCVGKVFADVTATYPTLPLQRVAHEATRRLIGTMIDDVLACTRHRLARYGVTDAESVRHMPEPLVGFSPTMQAVYDALRPFLFAHMYRHYRVARMKSRARRVVGELFTFFLHEPECLPHAWNPSHRLEPATQETAQAACMYVAGMTDRFALQEHSRVCGRGGSALDVGD
jgi:dGTPase